jgi:DNA polymerase (family X)
MNKIDIARAFAIASDGEPGLHGAGSAEPGSADPTELTLLSGLGPKRARQLHEELGISTLQELAAALEAGRVQLLKGFGAEAGERLSTELQQLLGRRDRFTLADAEYQVGPLIAYLQEGPGVERVDVAGSVRRRCETVGDVDLLVITARPAQVMRHCLAYGGAERVEAADASRARLRLHCGLTACIRLAPRRCYGTALTYLTGSVEHHRAARALGLERGIRMSEYGVFRLVCGRAGARRVGGQREEDVFAALGMEWIPPELREHRGELEAALEGRLPQLVTVADIRGDLHMRSSWSGGDASVEELVHACQKRGYEYCAITDPAHVVAPTHGTGRPRFLEQAREVACLRERLRGFRLLHGIEAAIRPDGTLDAAECDLDAAQLVIAAVHSHTRLSRVRMTDRILRALEHPAVDILAHPTGRMLGTREPYDIDIDAILSAAAELQVAVELNAHPARLDLNDVHVRRARELGAAVVINTGAAGLEALGHMRRGIDQARRGWLEAGDVLNSRSWDGLAEWLRRRRPGRSI